MKTLEGRSVKYGDNIDTDVIIPARYLAILDREELASHAMEDLDPDFRKKLEPGGSEHSFGIHVAEIAGMPRSIVKRANVILKELETDNAQVGGVGKAAVERLDQSREGVQLSFFQLDDPVLTQIRDEILGLDVNNLTPVEALNKLNDIKKILKGQ